MPNGQKMSGIPFSLSSMSPLPPSESRRQSADLARVCARNEINANPLELIPRAEWLNGGWIILVRAIGHTSRAANRFHGINHPRCASFPPRSWGFFSTFYDLAGGLLSTFSKARHHALWQIMHDFSGEAARGAFHRVFFGVLQELTNVNRHHRFFI